MSSSSLPIRLLRAADYELSAGVLLLLGGIWVFFVAFLFYPVAYMLKSAFVVDGEWTTTFFVLLFQDPTLLEHLLNSLKMGFVTTAMTFAVTFPLAYLMVRCEFKGKALMSGLLLVPLILPPFVGAIGMRQILARSGAVNQLLMLLNLPEVDWLSGGFWCVVALQVLHLYPIMLLNLSAALANVDRSIEEAAQSLGSSGLHLLRTVTLPLMLPGVFAGCSLVFIFAFTDLGTPLIFNYEKVIPVYIFRQVEQPFENPKGYAMIVVVIAVTLLLFWLSKRFFERRQVAAMPRGHVGEMVKRLHGWKAAVVFGCLGVWVFLAVLPHVTVIFTSLFRRWTMSILPQGFTGEFYATLTSHPLTVTSIKNSLLYSSLSTALDIFLGISIAYLLARRRIPGRAFLDATAMLPLALPGIVIAFGYVGCFSGTFLDPRNNPMPLLVISYAVRRLPYAVRACYAGFQQVSVTLEEASFSLGASPFRTLLKITAPLIAANIVAGAILSFAFAMLEVSDSLILALKENYYPITKAIYALMSRITQDAPHVASALGVVGMMLLAVSLFLASKLLGRRMGELFRA